MVYKVLMDKDDTRWRSGYRYTLEKNTLNASAINVPIQQLKMKDTADGNTWVIGARNNNSTFGIHKYNAGGSWLTGKDLI